VLCAVQQDTLVIEKQASRVHGHNLVRARSPLLVFANDDNDEGFAATNSNV
jgi:hypothetical protein